MSLSRNAYADFAAVGDNALGASAQLSDTAWLKALLRFEEELADAAATVGAVTEKQARTARAGIADYRAGLDVEHIARAAAAGANPAIPMVAEIKALLDDPRAVHFGATSQDAVDTATVLVVKEAAGIVDKRLSHLAGLLRELCDTHRRTPIMGRTLGQQALPTSFGLIAAGWLQGLAAARAALREAAAALPVQYAGATGDLQASAPLGLQLHDALAERLSLNTHPRVWHTDRQPVLAVAAACARVCSALRKIAGDIVAHSATEVGELREAHPGGSSAMPHKRNPAAAVACEGYARRAPGLTVTLFDAADTRHQRGVGTWHAEWQPLRELLAVTDNAAARLEASLDGITVDTEAMAARAGKCRFEHTDELIDDILERST
ncbi:3-carboxy-cis,cis-muconate cycloisomerase [Corynebacterium yudongzhengii]|uniref:3-carboxy-cis,cis-muconate cycloisomerase n=1 Tax=Corynebacterium yudongzhengii TaxID=2080740 RepID=A0A2U1T8Y0_9CORY|nr:lyase family protein [Corynebacterium yudongzhengii]AWB82491.1 3-carboxy-cis,cis-muconate cycloisomerase [Corynebacterium yudongzhengii]PWC02453.1 3-carboxy-cis,cis-muconate cycloisomerase [Corynebacterium yudongzhengii]